MYIIIFEEFFCYSMILKDLFVCINYIFNLSLILCLKLFSYVSAVI